MRPSFFLLALALLGCGGEPPVEATVATLHAVRGPIGDHPLHAPVRLADGERVEMAGGQLARLRLDGGATLLVREAIFGVPDPARLELERGHAYVETEGDAITVETPHASLRASELGASIVVTADETTLYVVRGELGWTRGDETGALGPGEQLRLGARGVEREALALFEDWTGGLAEAGPSASAAVVGVGTLEGRVPEEVGRARWPLVVRRLDVRVRVVRDLAITEVDQVFFNPASEALEGLYRIRVPEDAILSRFAVDREGHLVDGYVREREQAARAYQEQVYRGSTLDPALLEWDGPGAYRARIYPIGAGETRRIVVRYAEWLGTPSAGRPRQYRYPMGAERAPRVQELTIDVDLTEAHAERVRAGLGARFEAGTLRLRMSDVVPRADFWLELYPDEAASDAIPGWRAAHEPPARAPGAMAIPNEAEERDYWMVPLVLPSHLGADAPEGLDVVVVADLSVGTDRAALELGRSAIESVAALLGDDDRLAIVGADLFLRSVDGAPPALGAASPARVTALLDGVARLAPGGATDLGATLTAAARLLDPARRGIVLYVGDGVPTVGERTGAALRARLDRLPEPLRLYAIATGDTDLGLLEELSRGGGRAIAVRERHEAADAALDVLAHAARPVAHRVEVELGDRVERAFPRHAVDLVVGDVLAVIGRLEGDAPETVTVRGTIAGAPFEEVVPVVTEEAAFGTDLRLRWASARLRELMADGASREEVVELGVRHGLITPHTSFYVPSAAELRRMGLLALERMDRPDVFAEAPRAARPSAALALALGPFALAGCGDRDASDDHGIVSGPSTPPATTPSSSTVAPAPSVDRAPAAPVVPEAEPEAMEPAPDEPARPMQPRPARRRMEPGSGATSSHRDVGSVVSAAQARAAGCFAGRTGAGGALSIELTVGPDGVVTSARVIHSTLSDPALEACVLGAVRGVRGAATGQTERVIVPIAVPAGGGARTFAFVQTAQILVELARAGHEAEAHAARRCSDAAPLPLAERRELWRERLDAGQAWPMVRATAIAECEARGWRDRRALIREILAHVGGVGAMIAVAQQLPSEAERIEARAQVLARVRTPEDVRAVRGAFGEEVGRGLVEQVLARAQTPEARLRALRRLVAQYPRSFELRLRLLEMLDARGRRPEASRLASRLRADPLADATVRTAIGERLLRLGQRDEAQRAFSEMVEHAPLDELARRRLGDLYRAHGFHRAAYRQYETLRDLRPDDAGVLLSLARAAAGAGRVDEALRLEQRVGETAGQGEVVGLARVAQLWSSVRYARLLDEAAADEERLTQLTRRRRRSGVVRIARPLRVALTFAHPDAQLALLVGMPGLRPSRPMDIAPEHGIEVFELEEQEPGAYRLEVHREVAGPAIDAELLVLWNEGERDEQRLRIPLSFAGPREVRAFTLVGRTVTPE